MTIHTTNDTETERAFAECKRNGWRVTVLRRGPTNSSWILEVVSDEPEQPCLALNDLQREPIGSNCVSACATTFSSRLLTERRDRFPQMAATRL